MGVGGLVREFFEWAFVWGDVDPHGGGLGACEPDGCTVVVEVRATALFEGLGGGVEEAHACEVVVCLAVGQYVKQTEEVTTVSFFTPSKWRVTCGSPGTHQEATFHTHAT